MLEIALYSAIAPLILLLLSTVWKYPAVLEEVVKWGVLKLTANGQRPTVMSGAVVGVVFGVAESILYSSNAWASGDSSAIWMRLVLTVPMHALAAIATATGMKYKLGWLGLIVAMVIHGGFNYLIR